MRGRKKILNWSLRQITYRNRPASICGSLPWSREVGQVVIHLPWRAASSHPHSKSALERTAARPAEANSKSGISMLENLSSVKQSFWKYSVTWGAGETCWHATVSNIGQPRHVCPAMFSTMTSIDSIAQGCFKAISYMQQCMRYSQLQTCRRGAGPLQSWGNHWKAGFPEQVAHTESHQSCLGTSPTPSQLQRLIRVFICAKWQWHAKWPMKKVF